MKQTIIIPLIISLSICLFCCSGKKNETAKSGGLKDVYTEIDQGLPRRSISEEDKSCSPYFMINSDNPAASWMPLFSTQADVKITGAIAKVNVQQVYINKSKQSIDAIYVFPGSTRAAVYGLDMTIGKRTIHAKVMEREEARRGFNQAKSEGRHATLLEQDHPNVFRMEVANILPGDTIKVDMFYTELIEYRNKEYEFIYPTAVGPRYSNGNEDFVTQSIAQLESGHKPEFDIRVTIDGAIPVQTVESSTYQIKMKHNDDTSTTIALSNPKDTEPDKDFILYYGLQGGKVESGLTLYEHGNEKFFMFMMQPPLNTAPEEIFPREYIFIVDVSGSMHGFPLEISKTIVRNLIGSLKPTDRFNVLLFESSQSMLSRTSLPATKENIQKAINVIDTQGGSGGTELYHALKTAFNYKDPESAKYARTFIIATDGFVSIENEAFGLIAENISNDNFFALGIGENVNRYLIEGMAWAGASEPFIIENKTKADEIGKHLIRTISQPLLTNITIDWGKLEPYDFYPKEVPNVFTEKPIVIFGKYKGNADGNITVKGKTANGVFEQTIPSGKIVKSDNEALRYLWARNKIKYLNDYASCFEKKTRTYYSDNGEEYKKEIIELGLKYNLLTRYTSFLAVDNDQVSQYTDDYQEQREYTSYDIANKTSIQFNAPVISDEKSDYIMECEVRPMELKTSDYKEILDIAETMPQYPGGETELRKFIDSNLKYPEKLKGSGIQGRTILRFVIDENGNIKDIAVLRSLDPLCDNEAIRVLKLMPKWIPGKMGNKNVAVFFTLPFVFK